jgi:predicted MFS family arabinose efflux permease
MLKTHAPASGSGPEGTALPMFCVMLPLVVLSQFFRSSIGVIAPNLAADLTLSPEHIGLLSGSFFFIFAALQLPIGVLLDRYGGRRVLSTMMIATVIGAIVFAIAGSFAELVVARMLIGIGCAGLMIGSLAILGRWYAPARFATAMSILFASANAGGLVATLPLAAAATAVGWRTTFLGLALISGGLAIAFFLTVRDAPPSHAYHRRDPQPFFELTAGIRELLRRRDIICILPMIAIGYASSIAILGLWGGPYLHDIYGLAEVDRGKILSVMAIAMILGTLFYGPLDRIFNTRRGVASIGATIAIVPLLALACFPAADLWQTVLALALFGFFGAYSLVVMAHGLALVPEDLAGRGAAALNTALMAGAGIVQALTGEVVSAFREFGDPQSYAAVFGLLALLTGVALVIYRRASDVHPGAGRQPAAHDTRAATVEFSPAHAGNKLRTRKEGPS